MLILSAVCRSSVYCAHAAFVNTCGNAGSGSAAVSALGSATYTGTLTVTVSVRTAGVVAQLLHNISRGNSSSPPARRRDVFIDQPELGSGCG